MVRLSNGHIHCAFVDRTHLAVCDDPTTLQQQLSRVFSISTSPLPATWNLYTYVYPHHSLPIASPMAPHGRVCSLIRNTPQATAPQFLGAAFFHFQNAPEQGRKSPPPPILCIRLPVSTPIEVAAMSTSPHESTLCPMLPNHFILHAKSLARPALRAPLTQRLAFVPSLLRYTIHREREVQTKRAALAEGEQH